MRKAILLSLVLAGCAVGPDYKKPDVQSPEKYKEAGEWLVANPSDAAPKGEWWKVFRDPVLDELMGRVQIDNQNLRAAEARYRAARAQVTAARASLFPTVGVSTGANKGKSSGDVNATATRYTVSWFPIIARRRPGVSQGRPHPLTSPPGAGGEGGVAADHLRTV